MEMRSRERVLRIVLSILSRPYGYTRRDLAEKFNVSKKTIDEDLKEIEASGMEVDQSKAPHYKCAILPDRSFGELQYLRPLNTEEQGRISRAIDKAVASSKDADYLKRKLYSLYDFQKLGIRALRRPELEKLDSLQAALSNKQRVILEDYRSNSNEMKNRIVEPFNIDTEQNMLQAFDVEEQGNRHFKISRIKRVLLTEISWEFEAKHRYEYTDVFRIVNGNCVWVTLKLDNYAYNSLMENYPKAKNDLSDAPEKNKHYFESKVNPSFLGITNFLLANRGHVEIIQPDALKEHIRQEAQKIIDQINEQM